jgi:hypothetical protein
MFYGGDNSLAFTNLLAFVYLLFFLFLFFASEILHSLDVPSLNDKDQFTKLFDCFCLARLNVRM